MNRILALCTVTVTALSLSAQTVAISGNVTDQSQKPVAGAVVELKSKQLSDTTDALGAFSLTGGTGTVTSLPALPGAESLTFSKGVVRMQLMQTAPVRVELFDVRGNLLYRISNSTVAAGEYRFDIGRHPLAVKMLVVRVTAGGRSVQFRYLPLVDGVASLAAKAGLSSGGKLAKLQATVDSLQVTALGYKSKVVAISSYEETVNISLEMEDVGQCTESRATGQTVSGSGPHDVVIETNSDPGIKAGTIYRPADLGPGKGYPIFVWGEGACSQDGYSNRVAMGEIASWGYFIVADGTPGGGGGMGKKSGASMGDPTAFYNYITWAIAENRKPCSAYYRSLDTTKIAADGFSCGGLMSINASGDPRFTAIGLTSSGLFSADANLYSKIHTPIKIMNGGPASAGDDMAYNNGLRDYNEISVLGIPIIYFSKTSAGHGGDLGNAKGDFNSVNLAWLNWQLKGDEGTTGKAFLIGADCRFCKTAGWDFKSANLE